jgi:fluoride exporter
VGSIPTPGTNHNQPPLIVTKYLIVMLGAGLGGLFRFIVATAVAERFTGRFPLGTFLINITGSFGIGLLMTILSERYTTIPWLRLLLVVGILGGYTTFSSFEWETFTGARDGSVWIALSYVLTSVCAGYLAVWLGTLVARR